MKLRYTGAQPTTFMFPGVGEVEPGDEFEVPDDVAKPFLSRPDVEEVKPPAKPRKTTPKGQSNGDNDDSSED